MCSDACAFQPGIGMWARRYRQRLMTARAAFLVAAVMPLVACSSARTSSTAPVPVATAVRLDTLPTVVMTFPKESRDQTADPFYPRSRMEFPAPSRYRSANGSPGPDYWQQRADYKISATSTLRSARSRERSDPLHQ